MTGKDFLERHAFYGMHRYLNNEERDQIVAALNRPLLEAVPAPRAEVVAPEAQALTFFVAQSFADGYFDDEGDQAMKERIRKWLLTEAEKIPEDITIQEVIEKIIGPL